MSTSPARLTCIDIFCGLGGLSEGAEQAGAHVAIAIDHWRWAVDVHTLNRPATTHLHQDARQVDWRDMPHFDLLLGGPACQGHSTAAARGRTQPNPEAAALVRAKHEIDRATAWAMIDCAEVCSPEWFLAENVLAWLRWPLFDLFLDSLNQLGLHTRVLELNAADYGVPQARRRAFVLGSRRKDSLSEAAHLIEIAQGKARRGVGEVADFATGSWKPVDQCGKGSRDRILAGLELGVDQSTLTGADQHVLCRRSAVHRVEYRTLTAAELLAAQSFPVDYLLPEKYRRRDLCRAIGNAVPPELGRVIVSAIAAS